MTERGLIEEAVVEFRLRRRAAAARRDDRRGPRLDAAGRRGRRRPPVGGRVREPRLNVLIGGVDTTQSQLAHAIRLLAEHPDQWDALHADPSLAGRGRGGAAL